MCMTVCLCLWDTDETLRIVMVTLITSFDTFFKRIFD